MILRDYSMFKYIIRKLMNTMNKSNRYNVKENNKQNER